MIEDKYLTKNFTLYELTKTNYSEFQERNREVSEHQINKLTELSRLLEHVVFVLGGPIKITSGYRCESLNKTVGSTVRSQHLLCEAADFVPEKMDIGEAFRLLWRDIKDKGTNVGQLIFETAHRPYGYTSWIHISLGTPHRVEERCKQIVRMEEVKGAPVYTRLA